ncbi:MAG: anthranilate synthase component I family protein [Selenomonadaceae bacterium]
MHDIRSKLHPTLDEFEVLAETSNIIAISTEITTDLDTPVSTYYKLVGDNKGFILESVDTTHQQFGRYSFIGADPFVRLQIFKNRLMINENDLMKCIDGNPVDTINKYISSFIPSQLIDELPLANGGLVGYFNFEIAATFDRVRGVDIGEDELLGEFMMCRTMIIFDALKNSAHVICLAKVSDSDEADDVYETTVHRMESIRDKFLSAIPRKDSSAQKRKEKVDFMKRYAHAPEGVIDAIRKAKEYIYAGDIFQVVPSFRFTEKITKPAFHFYRRLRQVNPSPYMFYLNFGNTKLVGASPERLIKVSDGMVYTYPIAGTRRRGKNEAEDIALADDLKNDEKECAEHSMLVDLARNDIGRVSEPGTVHVTKFRSIEKFSHVIHMVSEVVGKLKDGLTPMDVFKFAFPAGTVSGAPKLRAMEIINELEPVRRGSYAGSVGYIDFCGNMDVCITLRTMRIENDENAYIQSGAGIVADSIPEHEYQEFLQKSKALFEVVEEVENDVVAFN